MHTTSLQKKKKVQHKLFLGEEKKEDPPLAHQAILMTCPLIPNGIPHWSLITVKLKQQLISLVDRLTAVGNGGVGLADELAVAVG